MQAALIDTLTDGVTDDSMGRKLIQNRPLTFAMAQVIASKEQQANRAFSIHRHNGSSSVKKF